MVKLIGRRTGIVVDTSDLPQDGIFDDVDAFWAAAHPPTWETDEPDEEGIASANQRQAPEPARRRSSVSFAGDPIADALDSPPQFGDADDDDVPQSPRFDESDGEEVVARQARTPDSRRRAYEPPRPDPSAEGLRRSRRARFPVMKWWKGERVIYEPTDMGTQQVSAVQLGVPTPRPKKRPRHTTRRVGGITVDATPLAPSEFDCDATGTECRLWNEGTQASQPTKFAARFDEHRFSALPLEGDNAPVMACQALATPEDAARDDVYPGWASGVMELPMGAVKGSESTGSLTMIFFVSSGQPLSVELALYPSDGTVVVDADESRAVRFQFSPGDQFYVSPNNTYRLENRSTTQPAKLFFCMLRPVADEDDEDD
jgi:hypothetical protein